MKRVLLKISWESLSSDALSIDGTKASWLASMIQSIKKNGTQVVIVLWWWNIYRWSGLIKAWVDPSDSHNMSMLSTVFNGVTLKNFLEKLGETVEVLDALGVEFLERYTAMSARKYAESDSIVICTSWWGTPFFTTDTTGVLRALELHCDAMIKLTKVDGVYDSDPASNPQAQKIDILSYDDFIAQDLKALDQTAIIMARDNSLPIYVSQMWDMKALEAIISGEWAGTKIS